MDNFLETYSPPKQSQEEINHFDRLISRNAIEYVIKKKHSLQTKPRTRWFHRWILPNIKELIPILLKLFQNIEGEGTLLKAFYKATIILVPKADKDTTKKKKIIGQYLWRIIDAKILNKIPANQIQKSHIPRPKEFVPNS